MLCKSSNTEGISRQNLLRRKQRPQENSQDLRELTQVQPLRVAVATEKGEGLG